MGTLFYLASVDSYFPLAVFDMQGTTCLLDVTRVCEPKENFPSAYLKYEE
jgi:hypothetical protein